MSTEEPPALRIEPPGFLSDPALHRVLAALPGARLVGGCVRDALAGRAVADVDLSTPMPPDEVVRTLRDAGLTSAPTGLDHGTVTAIADRRGFEVTTLRRDVQTDGRHAVVAFTDDWQLDAARRDFTINAMSMNPDGGVFDYFDGIADLAAGRVRFVGDAETRIAEDYLRVLRFFRFLARYGAGEPDEAALAAIRRGVSGLAQLSAERIWAELKRILAVDAPSRDAPSRDAPSRDAPSRDEPRRDEPDRVLRLMRETGVLDAVVPDASGSRPDRDGMLLSSLPADPILRLAALRPGASADRLRLSTAERERLAALNGPSPPDDADDAMLRRLLADTPKDILIGRVWLDRRGAALRDRLAAMPVPRFPLQGRDLQRAGIAPGPAMGTMLRELRAWWLDGGCLATQAELGAELARRRAG